MSIKKYALFICTFIFCGILYAQNKNIEFESGGNKITKDSIIIITDKAKDNRYKGHFYTAKKFSGSLERYLIESLQITKEQLFSNKPDVLRDSIFINQEIQYNLLGSNTLREMMMVSIQRAYSFQLRDTFLNEYETVYVVTIGDESRLNKFTLNDFEFTAITGDSQKEYSVFYKSGKPLWTSKGTLSLVKTKENMNAENRIRIVTDFPSKYDGLYKYMIPTEIVGENELVPFNSLLDLNPILFEYGMQIQKVTRPVIGKVVEFFDKVNSRSVIPNPYFPKIGQ